MPVEADVAERKESLYFDQLQRAETGGREVLEHIEAHIWADPPGGGLGRRPRSVMQVADRTHLLDKFLT